MPAKIVHVDQGSPAEKAGISAGWWLQKINGHPIRDVLDYKFYSYDSRLELTLSQEKDGEEKSLSIGKAEGEPLGLDFETYLMDKQRSCANKCVFCFIDQLPKGMRPSLYFKDDDARLSFLMGNYISMTNLSEADVQRIIAMHISPLNVSIHTTNPDLRSRMLGNPRGGESLEYLRRFARAGLKIMGQIVVCPGWNDGEELERTLEDLAAMHPSIAHVALAPVGLTRHREGLEPLRPVDREKARQIIGVVDKAREKCLKTYGEAFFYAADEFYLIAGWPLPGEEYYNGYPQLENGVGLMSLFRQELQGALLMAEPTENPPAFLIATGVSAAPFMEEMVALCKEKCPNLQGRVQPVKNDFFGHGVVVAGLLTGGDIIRQVKDVLRPGEELWIPDCMLRHGETVFLDDVSVEEMEQKLGTKVRVLPVDGGAFCDAIFPWEE